MAHGFAGADGELPEAEGAVFMVVLAFVFGEPELRSIEGLSFDRPRAYTPVDVAREHRGDVLGGFDVAGRLLPFAHRRTEVSLGGTLRFGEGRELHMPHAPAAHGDSEEGPRRSPCPPRADEDRSEVDRGLEERTRLVGDPRLVEKREQAGRGWHGRMLRVPAWFAASRSTAKERCPRIERVAGYAVAWNRIDVTMASDLHVLTARVRSVPGADEVLTLPEVGRDIDALRHAETRGAGAFERLFERQPRRALADFGPRRYIVSPGCASVRE